MRRRTADSDESTMKKMSIAVWSILFMIWAVYIIFLINACAADPLNGGPAWTRKTSRKTSSELMHMLVQGTLALEHHPGHRARILRLDTRTSRDRTGAVAADGLRHQQGRALAALRGSQRVCRARGWGLYPHRKGALLRQGTPAPDLLGLHHMFSYFTKAVQYSQEAYQKGMGLDSITQGKISRDYIPQVASQLSLPPPSSSSGPACPWATPSWTWAAATGPSCGRPSRPAPASAQRGST